MRQCGWLLKEHNGEFKSLVCKWMPHDLLKTTANPHFVLLFPWLWEKSVEEWDSFVDIISPKQTVASRKENIQVTWRLLQPRLMDDWSEVVVLAYGQNDQVIAQTNNWRSSSLMWTFKRRRRSNSKRMQQFQIEAVHMETYWTSVSEGVESKTEVLVPINQDLLRTVNDLECLCSYWKRSVRLIQLLAFFTS